jgi:hypothetical protein
LKLLEFIKYIFWTQETEAEIKGICEGCWEIECPKKCICKCHIQENETQSFSSGGMK